MSKIKTLYLPEGAMSPFETEEEAKRFLIEKKYLIEYNSKKSTLPNGEMGLGQFSN